MKAALGFYFVAQLWTSVSTKEGKNDVIETSGENSGHHWR
jgi:hypothetical protein